MHCSICEHEKRSEIELAILKISSDNKDLSIEKIAEQFEVDLTELKIHALFHTPLIKDPSGQQTDSLARQIKLREADALSEVADEYMVTLKSVGRKIRLLSEDEDPLVLSNKLTKPITDLYVNLGGEVRQSIKTLAELNQILNGDANEGLNGLAALAKALKASDKDD